jgi:hypothetical protein
VVNDPAEIQLEYLEYEVICEIVLTHLSGAYRWGLLMKKPRGLKISWHCLFKEYTTVMDDDVKERDAALCDDETAVQPAGDIQARLQDRVRDTELHHPVQEVQ